MQGKIIDCVDEIVDKGDVKIIDDDDCNDDDDDDDDDDDEIGDKGDVKIIEWTLTRELRDRQC